MKGKIGFDKKMNRFYVSWYHSPDQRTYKVWFYNRTIPLTSKDLAERLLANMRNDVERNVFRLDKYVQGKSEVIPAVRRYIDAKLRGNNKAPASIHTAESALRCHITPYFEQNLIALHEINYDVLMEFKNKLEGLSDKSKYEVLGLLKRAMEYAQMSDKIDVVPPFPKRDGDYNIEPKDPKWLKENVQTAVINAIPQHHQPVFWWLKYTMRRPGEAMALLKADLKDDVFTLHRTFSATRIHERTKNKHIVKVPMVEAFRPHYEWMRKQEWWMSSPLFFINPEAYSTNKERRYTQPTLGRIWREACKVVGVDIHLYAGCKHSSASQLINEYGMTEKEVELALACDPRTVKFYAHTEVVTRKRILDRVFSVRNEIARNSETEK